MTLDSGIRRFILLGGLLGGLLGTLLASSCSGTELGATRQTTMPIAHATFHHSGFAPGPVVFTDAAGHLTEERRIEPFGEPIGAHDLAARDLNPLNKRTEPATGWSDHGARWMAPETARWLSGDPPVTGPDTEHMFEPWKLHPYQYVAQNPVVYWDPDGRENFRAEWLEAKRMAEGRAAAEARAAAAAEWDGQAIVGTSLVGAGAASIVRIPIPGTDGRLGLELTSWKYKGVSTSAIFLQTADEKVHLRLDYGPNPATGKIDYHWNQKGTHRYFGIQNHSAAPNGAVGWNAARTFKWGGRVLLVAGAVNDVVSIFEAEDKARQAVKVAGGLVGAWAGAKAGGFVGGGIGTAVGPGGGTAVGGVFGGIIGGFVGAFAGKNVAVTVYDRVYTPLVENK